MMYARFHERERTVMIVTRRIGQVLPVPGGCPPDRAKDAAILTAASASLFKRGFTASTIEDIAAEAAFDDDPHGDGSLAPRAWSAGLVSSLEC